VHLVQRAWLWAGLQRWRLRREPALAERRRRLVRELAPGRSFIDVGGMWNMHGAMAFLAEEAGATRVVLMDGMDPTEQFEAERRRRDSEVRYVQGDLHDSALVEELGSFDVVWCTGVIYHSPNPYLLIESLRALTARRLLLGTLTIPEVPGFPAACLWYPGMPQSARRAFAAGYGGPSTTYLGMTTPLDRSPLAGYSNCWWGLTRSAVHGMLDAARLRVIEEFQDQAFALDVLAEPVPGQSLIPPVDFARRRGKQRQRERYTGP
jgi:hypothetical protein